MNANDRQIPDAPAGPELLIADDESVVRQAYRRLFEAEGYSVRVARNGEEALRLFAERRPDLVLLDVMMPKVGGIEACRRIRQQDPLVPVLFFTAIPSDISLVRGLGCNGDDYIEKTRSPAEFVARVARALRRRADLAEATRPDEIVRLGSITVDLGRMSVSDGAVEIATLTRSEGLVFRTLAARRGSYISNSELFDALHGENMAGDVAQVRFFVNSIRRKLGRARGMITTSLGVGYRLIK